MEVIRDAGGIDVVDVVCKGIAHVVFAKCIANKETKDIEVELLKFTAQELTHSTMVIKGEGRGKDKVANAPYRCLFIFFE